VYHSVTIRTQSNIYMLVNLWLWSSTDRHYDTVI